MFELAAKGVSVYEVPTLLPHWVPDGFGAFNPYGMGRHQVSWQLRCQIQRRRSGRHEVT